jgi:hypothetical protein
MNPYNDIRLTRQTLLREFNARIDDIEYTWHRDEDDRIIEVFSGAGWQLQLDNQLPVLLEAGYKYHIPAGMWHRLHKGQDNLTILISEGKKKKKKAAGFRSVKYGADNNPKVTKMDFLPTKTLKDIAKEKDLDEFVEAVDHPDQYDADSGKRKKQLDKVHKLKKDADKARKDGKTAKADRLDKRRYKLRDRMEGQNESVMDRDIMREYIEEIIEARRLFKAIEEDYMREDIDYDDDDINEKKKRKKRKKKKKKSKSGARTLSKAVKKSLDKKADRRCLTRGSVYAEFRAGLGAFYSSGSRKGMSAHQWAHARVNSANPSKSWARVKKRKKCPKKKKK